MTTITVSLADELVQRLQYASAHAQTTPDEIIKRAVVIYLSQTGTKRESLEGMFDFGDEHFAEQSEAILQSLTLSKGSWTTKA